LSWINLSAIHASHLRPLPKLHEVDFGIP
jgi:hypothetical protein